MAIYRVRGWWFNAPCLRNNDVKSTAEFTADVYTVSPATEWQWKNAIDVNSTADKFDNGVQ